MMFMLDWLLDIQYIYCGTIIKSYEGIFCYFTRILKIYICHLTIETNVTDNAYVGKVF